MKTSSIFLTLAAAFFTALPMSGQVNSETDEQDSREVTIDSLAKEVAQMRQNEADRQKEARDEKIWRKSKPMTFAYENVTLTDENSGIEYKSKMAFAMSKRRTYYVGKPIAHMIQLGIDATWFDLSYAQFEKGKGMGGIANGFMGGVTDGTYDNMDDYFDHAYDQAITEDGEGDSDIFNRMALGKHRISFNLGVGPSIKVAPFYALNKKALDKLKVSAYFHWLPGYSALLFTGDETEVSHGALMRNFGIGFNISYGRLGIGIEHRWGKSKMNNWQVDDDDDKYDYSGSGAYGDTGNERSSKIDYKHSITRFYIGFRF